MLNLIPTKVKLTFGAFVLFIIIITIFVALSTPPTESPTGQPPIFSASPTALPFEEPDFTGPSPESVYQTPFPELEDAVEKNRLNGLLLEKLPFVGNNFSLRYDGVTNSFIASYSPENEEAGQLELLEFLSLNDIESTTWLKNFKTETE